MSHPKIWERPFWSQPSASAAKRAAAPSVRAMASEAADGLAALHLLVCLARWRRKAARFQRRMQPAIALQRALFGPVPPNPR